MAGNLYEQGYYETGTASVTQGQTVVTGQGTAWSQIVRPADDFGKHVGMPIPIASVDSDTQITLAYPWPGPTQAAAPYRVTFTPYHVAYRQALQEIGQMLSSGNVSALAGLVGAANKIPIFTGPGALEVIAKQDLVNGVRFDVQVADLAGRAAYDNQAAGFTVLVADVGDGRSAIYTKDSVAAADWSDPAYVTGPTGATGSPWDDWQGAWATATAYDKLSGVENNGSSYICTTAHTSDAASEPGVGASWQTYWDVVAAKGLDGDIVGPNGATDGNVALFDGTTGKLLKEGGALGSAAFAATGDFATAAEGVLAQNAEPALGFTPVNRAGDTMTGKLNRASQPYINCTPAGGGSGYRSLVIQQNSGFSLSGDSLHVVIPENGRYRISIMGMQSGTGDFRIPITINGVAGLPSIRTLGTESTGSMSLVRQLSAGDIVSFNVTMGTNHPDGSFQNLTVEMI